MPEENLVSRTDVSASSPKRFEVVHDPLAVPLAVKLLYWTDLTTTILVDAPLMGLRPFQSVLLPEKVLSPEMRLIAQGNALSHLAQTAFAFYLGSRNAPDTELGKLAAWTTTLFHVFSTFLIVRYGIFEENAFTQSFQGAAYHSALTLLGFYALYLAHSSKSHKRNGKR